MRTSAVVVLAVAALGGARVAHAHQSAVKYLDVDVRGADATLELRFQAPDATRPLGLPDDAMPTADAALAGRPAVIAFVAPWVAVSAQGAACAVAGAPVLDRAAADPRFLALRWSVRCPAPVERLGLDLAEFFSVDRRHEMVLHLTSALAPPYDTTIGVAASPLSLALGEEAPSGAVAWIARGAREGFAGPIHVGVVLALLLAAVIARRDGAWTLRAPRDAIARAAAAIGAFVAGQSAGLGLGAAGVAALPGGFAEPMLGLAVVYLALETALAPEARWRFVATAAFGAVAGIALARDLAPLVPAGDGSGPVAFLAAGVALVELAVAAVALPTALLLGRVVGAERYRRVWMPILSVVLAILGGIWAASRVG
jgi:hypothetical protein